MPTTAWLLHLLDGFPEAIGVVGNDGRAAYANRAARAALAAEGKTVDDAVCPSVLEAAQSVRSHHGELRGVVVDTPSGERWRGRLWPHQDDLVALVLHREALRPTAAARVAAGLALEVGEARLAVFVAEGLTNAEIASKLRVPLTTINGRVSTLCRKLGARRRTGVVAHVVRCLTAER